MKHRFSNVQTGEETEVSFTAAEITQKAANDAVQAAEAIIFQAEADRDASLDTAISLDAMLLDLKTKDNDEMNTYLTANVSTDAQIKNALHKLIKVVVRNLP